MKTHPELVRIASVRCRISVERLIYDAMLKQRFCHDSLTKLLQRYTYLDEVPSFVEDYALKLLAEQERKEKETCLLNGFDQWRRKNIQYNL